MMGIVGGESSQVVKVPPALLANNPLDITKASIEKLVGEVEFAHGHELDALKGRIDTELIGSRALVKSMSAFT
jgi:hypothetical protein